MAQVDTRVAERWCTAGHAVPAGFRFCGVCDASLGGLADELEQMGADLWSAERSAQTPCKLSNRSRPVIKFVVCLLLITVSVAATQVELPQRSPGDLCERRWDAVVGAISDSGDQASWIANCKAAYEIPQDPAQP